MVTSSSSSNPWFQIWLRPRQAIVNLVSVNPRRGIVPLTVLSGVSLFSLINLNPPSDTQTLIINLGTAIILGTLFGLLHIFMGSRIFHAIAQRFGAENSLEETQAVMAWATIPRLLLLGAWLLPFSPLLTQQDGIPLTYTLLLAGLAVITLTWEIAIFLQGMTAISRLSSMQALTAGAVAMSLILAVASAIFLLMRKAADSSGQVETNSPLLTITLLVMGLVFSIFFALRSTDEDSPEPAMVERMESWQRPLTSLDDLELAKPRSTRLLHPFWAAIQKLGSSITPRNRIEALQKDLMVAGHPNNLTVTDFLGLRFLSIAIIGCGVVVYSTLMGGGPKTLLIMGGGFIVGWNLPDYWLRKRIAARQKDIQRSLPDALDMLSICVDAGLGFEAAILRVANKWDNELAQELQRVVNEIRVGVRRSDALRHLTERCDVPDVGSFVAIIVQADRLGISIGPVLQSQSEQMRTRRRQRAEEEAQKAPVKMLMPLAVFILPATFAVSLGPAVPRMLRMFG